MRMFSLGAVSGASAASAGVVFSLPLLLSLAPSLSGAAVASVGVILSSSADAMLTLVCSYDDEKTKEI